MCCLHNLSTCVRVKLNEAQESLVQGFTVYLHDVWARDLLDKSWQEGKELSEGEKTHPELVPFEQLPAEVGHLCVYVQVYMSGVG